MTPLQTMVGGLSNQANISIGEEVEISCKLVQGHSENKNCNVVAGNLRIHDDGTKQMNIDTNGKET